MNTQALYTFVPAKPIREMVAAAVVRAESLKVCVTPIRSDTEMWCEIYQPTVRKPTKRKTVKPKPYSNKYPRLHNKHQQRETRIWRENLNAKSAAPITKRNEQREVLPTPVAVTPAPVTPSKPSKPQSKSFKSYMAEQRKQDAQSEYQTPAQKAGAEAGMKAIADKAKYAKVTEKIMSGEKSKSAQDLMGKRYCRGCRCDQAFIETGDFANCIRCNAKVDMTTGEWCLPFQVKMQSAVSSVPAGQRERSVSLSNTHGRRNAP